jgi:FAD/FMN-containing dehydrogenase
VRPATLHGMTEKLTGASRVQHQAKLTNVLRRLRDDHPAGLVLPGDEDWDAARAAWNLVVDQRSAAVAFPTTADDVVQVVHAARAGGLRVAAQATGHAAGALAVPGDTVLLRTDRMRGVEIDASARRARVAAGALWLDVTAPASDQRLAPLAGSSPNVGVVGYSLGGGLSWLGRRYGLACNSVTGIEIVTADGRLRHVDAEHDSDLFWALRGGGGNFGVVTALEFDLYPTPQIYAGWLAWPWERTRQVLGAWIDWVADVPDTVTSTARLLRLPPAPELPEPLRGRDLVAVEAAMLHDQDTGATLLSALRGLRPELDTFATVAPVALSRLHLDPERPVAAITDAILVGELSGQALDALVATVGPGADRHLAVVELRHLGGALARPAPDAGALATLDGSFLLHAGGSVDEADTTSAVADRIGTLFDTLRPWDTGRRYGNFAESFRIDTRTFFTTDTYRRLSEVKAAVDPDGLFLANHTIP